MEAVNTSKHQFLRNYTEQRPKKRSFAYQLDFLHLKNLRVCLQKCNLLKILWYILTLGPPKI